MFVIISEAVNPDPDNGNNMIVNSVLLRFSEMFFYTKTRTVCLSACFHPDELTTSLKLNKDRKETGTQMIHHLIVLNDFI